MKRKLLWLGYCGKCGHDVTTDYCYRCQRQVQPKAFRAFRKKVRSVLAKKKKMSS